MTLYLWRWIPGYEGKYMINEFGQVYSFYGSGRFIKPGTNNDGYKQAILFQKNKLISRSVAQAFLPNPQNKATVNHKDGNKLNNHWANLEWCTCKENIQHAWKTGLVSAVGEKNGRAKLKEYQVREIRGIGRSLTQKEIGERYGVHRAAIGLLLNKKNWKHVKV